MKLPPERRAPSWAEGALDEHRDCMVLVEAVERCLEAHPDDADRWVGNLQRELERLDRALREHFRSEEAGALFGQLPLRYPRLASRLERLKAEHATLLEIVDRAHVSSRKLRGAELHQLRELNARVQLLVARIRRHEAAENEILFEANWDEVGVGD